jgi:hypothetical protein
MRRLPKWQITTAQAASRRQKSRYNETPASIGAEPAPAIGDGEIAGAGCKVGCGITAIPANYLTGTLQFKPAAGVRRLSSP